jgi:two-component system NtrC family sensor kinase
MSEETKRKIFEPFFTTKDVGQGTGLGMSIAFNTIQKHNGQIVVDSEVGRGTSFKLIIPINEPV